MYRLPADVDWSFLVGSELIQLCIGMHQIQMHFLNGVHIYIEGDFQHEHKGIAHIGGGRANLARRSISLVSILHKVVRAVTTEGDRVLVLQFDDDAIVKIIDDSDQYESFQIGSPKGLIIV